MFTVTLLFEVGERAMQLKDGVVSPTVYAGSLGPWKRRFMLSGLGRTVHSVFLLQSHGEHAVRGLQDRSLFFRHTHALFPIPIVQRTLVLWSILCKLIESAYVQKRIYIPMKKSQDGFSVSS